MNIHEILAQPMWARLVEIPGFASLSAPAIETANSFFDYIVRYSLPAPTAGDIRTWLGDCSGAERSLRIDHLEDVFALCQPSFLPAIRDARQMLPLAREPARQALDHAEPQCGGSALRPAYEARDWDPIAPPSRRPPKPRHVSIAPGDLPVVYQSELRRAADGLPGREPRMRVRARSMVLRMREKLCQYAWSAGQAGLDPELSLAGIDFYFDALKTRITAKSHGLRWATLRATSTTLLDFARYSGAPPGIAQHLRGYVREFAAREAVQRALKFFALARTGNSTDRMLDLAEALLVGVAAEERPRKRHQMRNAAAILAIFANAPLRNASAQLVFGETLLWLQGEWVIITAIQKTETSRPEIFRFPLHREAGRFIDVLILGDASPAMLPVLRESVEKSKRQLFVLPDGAPAAATYVPRIFQSLTGNSFTTLRVMLYSAAITDHGVMGIEMAKPAAHHASTRIVKECYVAEQVAETEADNFRRRRRNRIREDRQDYGDLMSNLVRSSYGNAGS